MKGFNYLILKLVTNVIQPTLEAFATKAESAGQHKRGDQLTPQAENDGWIDN